MDITKTSSNRNPNSKMSIDDNRRDTVNTSANGYEYVPTLKTAGYVVGQPISVPSRDVRPTTPKLGEDANNSTSRITTSRINSRIAYGPDVIVHEHPSRPARSPSPISTNPRGNIIPQANFIYNSSNQFIASSPPPPRIVSYSPAKTTTVTTVQAVPMPVHMPIPTSVPMPVPVPVSPKVNTANMVPRAQYERCVAQCRTWQERYNQLYGMYMKMNNQKINRSISDNANKLLGNNQSVNNMNTQQYDSAMRQNRKLKERVRDLEANQQRLVSNMEDIITRLVNKYRDSTLKECMLLADRYRLEKKMNQKI